MDIQIGRVVGYSTQRSNGVVQTAWARVIKQGIEQLLVEPHHGTCMPRLLIATSSVHTVMPSSY